MSQQSSIKDKLKKNPFASIDIEDSEEIEEPSIDSNAESVIFPPEQEEEANDIIVVGSLTSSIVDEEDVKNTESLLEMSAGMDSSEEDKNSHALVISYNPWDILKKSCVNLILPFINGMMLGFGEILAHEIGFRYNWVGARVQPPRRMQKKEASKFL